MGASTALTFSEKRRWRKLCAALFVLAAAGASVAAQTPRGGEQQAERARIESRRPPKGPAATLFFCQSRDVACRTEDNEFRLDQIRDLFVFAAFREVRGEHTALVRFLLPDGNVYQSLESKFTTVPGAKADGVQATALSRGEHTVVVDLAVAGTHITQRSLAGTWTVELYLDGDLVARRNLVFQPRGQ